MRDELLHRRGRHPLAGTVVRIHVAGCQTCGPRTGAAIVEDWWVRVSATVWEIHGPVLLTRQSPVVTQYVARRLSRGLDATAEPVYVHQDGLGYLVAACEIEGVLDGPEQGLVTIDVAALGGGPRE